MASNAFTESQVDAAIDHVVRHGAENRASTITYSHVFEAAQIAAPQELHHGGEGHLVTEFMEAFHHRCAARSLPPLDALVINAAGDRGGMPGVGYFRVNGHPDPLKPSTRPEEASLAVAFWETQRDECRQWGVRSRRTRSTALGGGEEA